MMIIDIYLIYIFLSVSVRPLFLPQPSTPIPLSSTYTTTTKHNQTTETVLKNINLILYVCHRHTIHPIIIINYTQISHSSHSHTNKKTCNTTLVSRQVIIVHKIIVGCVPRPAIGNRARMFATSAIAIPECVGCRWVHIPCCFAHTERRTWSLDCSGADPVTNNVSLRNVRKQYKIIRPVD